MVYYVEHVKPDREYFDFCVFPLGLFQRVANSSFTCFLKRRYASFASPMNFIDTRFSAK